MIKLALHKLFVSLFFLFVFLNSNCQALPAYSATVTGSIATAITGALLPANGYIQSVAINDSGAAIIGGVGSIPTPTPTTGIRSWLLKQG